MIRLQIIPKANFNYILLSKSGFAHTLSPYISPKLQYRNTQEMRGTRSSEAFLSHSSSHKDGKKGLMGLGEGLD